MVLFIIVLMILGAGLLGLGCIQIVQSRKYAFKNPKLAQTAKVAQVMIGTGLFLFLIAWWSLR